MVESPLFIGAGAEAGVGKKKPEPEQVLLNSLFETMLFAVNK